MFDKDQTRFTLHVIYSAAVFLFQFTFVYSCSDVAGVVKDGKTCSELVTTTTKRECYDSAVETSCCQSCSAVATNIPNCKYGDRAQFCQPFACSSIVNEGDCCETCFTGTTTTTTQALATTTTPPTTTITQTTITPSPPPTTTTTATTSTTPTTATSTITSTRTTTKTPTTTTTTTLPTTTTTPPPTSTTPTTLPTTTTPQTTTTLQTATTPTRTTSSSTTTTPTTTTILATSTTPTTTTTLPTSTTPTTTATIQTTTTLTTTTILPTTSTPASSTRITTNTTNPTTTTTSRTTATTTTQTTATMSTSTTSQNITPTTMPITSTITTVHPTDSTQSLQEARAIMATSFAIAAFLLAGVLGFTVYKTYRANNRTSKTEGANHHRPRKRHTTKVKTFLDKNTHHILPPQHVRLKDLTIGWKHDARHYSSRVQWKEQHIKDKTSNLESKTFYSYDEPIPYWKDNQYTRVPNRTNQNNQGSGVVLDFSKSYKYRWDS